MKEANPGLNAAVWELRKIRLDGNIVPHTFSQAITTRTSGGKIKPHLLAIMADIVYWYRPVVEVDEATGDVSHRQKFAADKLQKSYSDWAIKFGSNKRAVKAACDLLRRLGLVVVEFRCLAIAGITLQNIMFVEPVWPKLLCMLFPEEMAVVQNFVPPHTKNCAVSLGKKVGGGTKKPTYTTEYSNTFPKSTTTVAVDPKEEIEYHPDRLRVFFPEEVLAAIEYVFERSPHLPQGKICHSAWVLLHQKTAVKMWPNAIVATIQKGNGILRHALRPPNWPSKRLMRRIQEE